MWRPDICIHHAPCADGFTAAWAIWKKWPDIRFHPGVYGAPPPDVTGLDVLIVDFSYKRAVLEEMGKTARTITILDHHKTAQEDLAPFTVAALLSADLLAEHSDFGAHLPIQAIFDMDRSGAMLAWNYAHPLQPAPCLVEIVQDRDLWRFEFAATRAISANLFSYPYEFAEWDRIANILEDSERFADFAGQGDAIERKHQKDVRELLEMTTRWMMIGGFRVPVANLPYTMASDAANQLARGQAFGACYYDNAEGKRVFSLRSVDGGQDVSEIAAAYGGGGHAKASGFSAAPGWEGDST